jgi:hypothetical protein
VTNRTPWKPTASTAPYLRRVHIRRDEDGLWFWFHPVCRVAEAQFDAWGTALESASAHAAGSHEQRPEKTFCGHIEVDPDRNSLRASWLCPWCKQYCPSHNPCDCCMDPIDVEGE